jgi:hypothetical protein
VLCGHLAGDAATQLEMLQAVSALSEAVPGPLLKAELLPRMNGVCLSTTNGAVRTQSLVALGQLLPRCDREDVVKMLATAHKVARAFRAPSACLSLCLPGPSVYPAVRVSSYPSVRLLRLHNAPPGVPPKMFRRAGGLHAFLQRSREKRVACCVPHGQGAARLPSCSETEVEG